MSQIFTRENGGGFYGLTAALSWPGGQSEDRIRSHGPVRRYPPFHPSTHHSPRPLRYRDYAHSARNSVRTYVPDSPLRTEPMKLEPSRHSFFFYGERQVRTRYPSMTGIFRADSVSPKADSDIDKKSTPSFSSSPS
jgi:hypothetical protein